MTALPGRQCPAVADLVAEGVRRAWNTQVHHLDMLAGALGGSGLDCARRYGDAPPGLRVFHPVPDDQPARLVVGEYITVTPGPGSLPAVVWWFRSSTGALLAPCADTAGAVAEIGLMLAPFTPGGGGSDALLSRLRNRV